MNKSISLALENISYSINVKDIEELTLILPHLIPNVKPEDNKVQVVDDVNIRVYIQTYDTIPEIKLYSENEVTIGGSLDLQPNSLAKLELSTTNGGSSWVVKSTSSVEDSEQTAENAQKIANEAKASAETANTVANEAKTSAEIATYTANTANTIANDAKTIADTASTNASTAIYTANTANTIANDAKTSVESLNNSFTTLNADAIKSSVTDQQDINSNLMIANGNKFLVEKEDKSNIVGMFVGNYPELVDQADNNALEQLEIGSTTTLMCLNHCGVTYKDGDETKTVDGHIRVDYRENISSPVVQDQLAYMSDIKNIQDSTLKLNDDGYQKLNTGVTLANGKKLLVEAQNGGTYLGTYVGCYNELTDKATNAGLEQLEIGSPHLLMCLNHCGAEFTDSDGTEKVVDHHIRVDYKVKAGEPTVQDQLAYMSDIKTIHNFLKDLSTTLNLETEHPEIIEKYPEIFNA